MVSSLYVTCIFSWNETFRLTCQNFGGVTEFLSETICPLCVPRGNFGNKMQGTLCVTFHPYNLVQYPLFRWDTYSQLQCWLCKVSYGFGHLHVRLHGRPAQYSSLGWYISTSRHSSGHPVHPTRSRWTREKALASALAGWSIGLWSSPLKFSSTRTQDAKLDSLAVFRIISSSSWYPWSWQSP